MCRFSSLGGEEGPNGSTQPFAAGNGACVWDTRGSYTVDRCHLITELDHRRLVVGVAHHYVIKEVGHHFLITEIESHRG